MTPVLWSVWCSLKVVVGCLSAQPTPMPVSDNGTTLSVDDGGGSLTVDGTVAATQSGTWSMQITDGVETASVDASNRLEVAVGNTVTIQDGGNVISIDDGGATLSVDDGGSSLTVDGSVTADTELTTDDLDTGAGTDTRAVVGLVLAEGGGGVLVGSANPVPISDNGTTLSVDDGAGSLTVDQATHDNLNCNANLQVADADVANGNPCLLYTSPSPRDLSTSRMPSSA